MLAKVVQAIPQLVVERSAACVVARCRQMQVLDRSFSSLFACLVIVAPALELVLVDEQLELLLCTAESIPH